jgi:hypothetical protein
VNIPDWMATGGTPLNECMMAAIPVVNRFRAQTRAQIVNTIFITDGCGMESWGAVISPDYQFGSSYASKIIRDRKLGLEWHCKDRGTQPAALANAFRARTGSKLVNFYIIPDSSTSFNSAADHRGMKKYADKNGGYAKFAIDGGFVFPDSDMGWDQEYLIPGRKDDDIETFDKNLIGADTERLNDQFRRSAQSKLRGRIVLKEFAGLIAE